MGTVALKSCFPWPLINPDSSGEIFPHTAFLNNICELFLLFTLLPPKFLEFNMLISSRNTYSLCFFGCYYSAVTLPSDSVMLHYHHQYYGLIRHLDCYLLFRFLIRRSFSEIISLRQTKASQTTCPNVSPLIPRRWLKPLSASWFLLLTSSIK